MVPPRRIRTTILCLWALVLAGCVPYPERPSPPPEARPSGFPDDFYKAASERGEPVFVIVPSESPSVLIRVYREGALAFLGHDHVVSGRQVHGYARISQNLSQARTDVYLPVDSLIVDEPGPRAEAGFTSEISQEDIAATRRRMLDEVLDSAQYPFILIHGVCAADAPSCGALDARITLRGVTRAVRIPIELRSENDRLVVSGRFSIQHSDFGMTPFSALGGSLRVADRIDVEFRLEARPL
jgi:hypothetical protein